MKKILISAVLALSSCLAAAAGPIDGIYACSVNLLGTSYSSYVTINGHADGSTIYTVAAVSPSQTFYGYGIGSATATSFTGSTMFGAPFNLTINPATGGISGTIGILWNGSVVNATSVCGKIW